jgi:Probable transposase
LARLHARIANIRKDATHKATTYLTKTFKRIGIEDLNVRGMVRNRHLARSIMDVISASSGASSNTRPGSTARGLSSPTDGSLQARPVLAAARSKTSWTYRNGPSIAMTVDLSATAI